MLPPPAAFRSVKRMRERLGRRRGCLPPSFSDFPSYELARLPPALPQLSPSPPSRSRNHPRLRAILSLSARYSVLEKRIAVQNSATTSLVFIFCFFCCFIPCLLLSCSYHICTENPILLYKQNVYTTKQDFQCV